MCDFHYFNILGNLIDIKPILLFINFNVKYLMFVVYLILIEKYVLICFD